MKKTLIAAAAAVALTASAAAEITFGAWVRTLPIFAASDGDKVTTGFTNSWGWSSARPARVDINAVAEDGNVGFTMGVYNDAFSGLGDSGSARMWAKPIEQVKLTVGSMSADNNVGGYRGDFCYGSWNWLRPFNWITDGEGFTFDGISGTGALIEVFPVEGLSVYAHVPLDKIGNKVEAATAFKNAQAGFAYDIDGVGKLKAQYKGNYTPKVEAVTATPFALDPATGKITGNEAVAAKDEINDPSIQAAFELTSVENLYATVGFGYTTDSKDMHIAAGVSYQVTEEAKVYGSFEMLKLDAKDATEMAFGVGADYNLGDGLALNADVRGLMMPKEVTGGDDETYLSFLLGVTKGISSNGLIGIGFQGTTNGFGFLNVYDNGRYNADASKDDAFCWAIPVRVEMWF
jgi:outer membrane protein W